YGHFVSAGVEEHVRTFLDHGATAILCGNDLIAYGVTEECKRLGKSVPEDISIIGYDDLPSSAYSDPPLTSVKQDRSKLGKCSYYVLYALINEVALSRNLLRTTLTIRKSTDMVKNQT
ncbi:MAG: substrate-binding domain-containing protein, partial [Lachnospiraceae bacterium]|nr:substrate-binding domain-containing protein [Lachnospiraceae bacterium]